MTRSNQGLDKVLPWTDRLKVDGPGPDSGPKKLLKLPEMDDKIRPVIQTDAKPEAFWLLRARDAVRGQSHLRNGSVKDLHAHLSECLSNEAGAQILECASYLIAERQQLGEGIREFISPVTGKLIALVTKDDLWQPPQRRGLNGELYWPLKQIRPDLEGKILVTLSEECREQEAFNLALQQLRGTDIEVEETDPRLQALTFKGRQEIITDIAASTPQTLISMVGGTSRAFLNCFSQRAPTEEERRGLNKITVTCQTKSQQKIGDTRAQNLNHSRSQTLRLAAVQSWVRTMANQVSNEAYKYGLSPYVTLDAGAVQHFQEAGIKHTLADVWVANPSDVRSLPGSALPVDGVRTIGLSGHVGYIVLPASLEAAGLERFDRWETYTAVQIEMWVDLSKILKVNLTGVVYEAEIVE